MARNGSCVKVFVGVSGFSYSSWVGRFYPEGLKSDEFLGYYSKHLGSVEINSSFYAPPSTTMIRGWSAKTETVFRFAFKAPRLITHILKLGKGAPEASKKLSATLSGLGHRRGPILFQLPPFSKLNQELLQSFLTETGDLGPKVFEFRHPSWFTESIYRLLDEHQAGFCIAETEDLEPIFKVTGGLAYFRLRKDSYDVTAIDTWSKKIRKSSDGAKECYVYLRHDETGENALLAQRLSKSLQDS
jgi:uncharacterized protein YecE (DUF72 family)